MTRGLATFLVSMALAAAVRAQTPAPAPPPPTAPAQAPPVATPATGGGPAAAPSAAPAEPPPPEVGAAATSAPAPAPPAPPPPIVAQPEPVAVPAPPPPPAEPPRPRRYADQGTSEIGLGLGYSSFAGFFGAGAFRYFVIDGVAPGIEGNYLSGGTASAGIGMALASLRLVPVRTANLALVLTGRAGRVFVADHADGWTAGGSGGVIYMLSRGFGVEIAYEVLRLLPASFCSDFDTCTLHRPIIGLRLVF